jgi:hypothetical protein
MAFSRTREAMVHGSASKRWRLRQARKGRPMSCCVLHPCSRWSCDEYRSSSAIVDEDERQETSALCHGENESERVSLVRPLCRDDTEYAALVWDLQLRVVEPCGCVVLRKRGVRSEDAFFDMFSWQNKVPRFQPRSSSRTLLAIDFSCCSSC